MLTALDTSSLPVITKPGRICILQSKWHFNLVQSMTEACIRVLAQAGYTKIVVHTFLIPEVPLAARDLLAEDSAGILTQ